MSKTPDKFEFNIGFQWSIIKFTLIDPKGYKALLLYQASYFELIEQKVIVKAIQRIYKRRGKLLGSSTTLIENLKPIYKHRAYANTLMEQDRRYVIRKVKALDKGLIKD